MNIASRLDWTVIVVALLLLLVVGCTSGSAGAPVAPDTNVRYVHDATHGVGCWLSFSSGVAMSCLPDSAYQNAGKP